ncbi:hypothetical protein MPH_03828 [Macrophomina phaseolina MS6]|uniref:Uncharacterized protein n=1 Tax=Macrophomina phaseolina (strain MS6) TaxID=1126212 RepID=K2S1F9_MACPH|nr:hypothetical protein MPH_03828 [Macrophomina phaseolina MS6]
MVDVHSTQQLPQWTVEKSYHRSQNNESPASTPDLDDQDRIRLARSSTMPLPSLEPPSMLQDRYLSSEEDLSPTVSDSAEQSDDDNDDDEEIQIVEATSIVSPLANAQPCKVAKAVSYVSAGRAKVVDMNETHPTRERTFSVPAVANAVPILKSPVPRMSRMSLGNYRPPASTDRPALPRPSTYSDSCSSPIVPPRSERRKSSAPARERPSITRSPLSYDPASAPPVPSTGSLRSAAKVARHYSMAAAPSSSIYNTDRPKLMRSTTDLRTTLSPSPPPLPTRSHSTEPEPTSPMLERPPVPADAELRRPSSVRSSYSQSPHSKRSSTLHVRQRSGSVQLPPFAPNASPLTPETPTFLNTDPFAKKEEDKPEDTGKPAHRRLRSISRTLSLAKIALVPQNKRGSTWGKSKGKADKNHRDSMDLLSPISPMTHSNVPKENFLTVSSPLAPNMPPTPVTPGMSIPPTPSTAAFSPRTASRLSNNTIDDEKEVERPPRTSSLAQRPRLVPRGADAREPPLQIPPFPDSDDEVRVPGRRRLTKRKSMLGFA